MRATGDVRESVRCDQRSERADAGKSGGSKLRAARSKVEVAFEAFANEARAHREPARPGQALTLPMTSLRAVRGPDRYCGRIGPVLGVAARRWSTTRHERSGLVCSQRQRQLSNRGAAIDVVGSARLPLMTGPPTSSNARVWRRTGRCRRPAPALIHHANEDASRDRLRPQSLLMRSIGLERSFYRHGNVACRGAPIDKKG